MTAGPGPRFGLRVGLAAALGLLLLHAAAYWFLTDDAFISFRYARHLAEGRGLVFNPGFDRVEGYTNFLWVLLLALFDRVGAAPERTANVLSLLLSVGLWALVARASWQRGDDRPAWIVLFPPLALASTRSVAVWSTGGLETRLFEVLVVAGALLLVDDVRSEERRAPRPVPWGACLFALASLTRPDGLLVGGCALGAALAWLGVRGHLRAAHVGRTVLAFGAPVAAHFLFRFLYYGSWLPNTYYAKVSGTWWGMGGCYLALFALEYGVVFWIPFLAAAVAFHRRQGDLLVPLVYGAVALPHALYVASIGGDHFEFRPLDLYFPLAFLLIADGAAFFASRPRSRSLVAAALGVVLAGLVAIPLRTHLDFPVGYQVGFPGLAVTRRAGVEYLDPSRSVLFRWPGLSSVARAHRDLLRETTLHFVGIRQEEHRAFLATLDEEAGILSGLKERGVFPADLHVAVSCVGLLPYRTEFRTLDRLGLTDPHVARSRPRSGQRIMAHEREATLDYARDQGVDLWAIEQAHLLVDPTDPGFLSAVRGAEDGDSEVYLADVGGGRGVAAVLPGGLERARTRMPRLRFEPLKDPEVRQRIVDGAMARWRRLNAADPADPDVRASLARVATFAGDDRLAARLWRGLARDRPDEIDHWLGVANSSAALGEREEAIAAAEKAIELARGVGFREAVSTLRKQIDVMRRDRP